MYGENTMNRYDRIIQLLKTNGYLNVSDLCSLLNVSPATIRRDLTMLEQKAMLKRVSGGAILMQTSVQDFKDPLDRLIEEKKKIAKQAITYVEPGMTIFIDSGTTNNEIAKLLLDVRNVFVITNSIHIAYLLYSNKRGNSVFVCGGNIGEGGEASIVGTMAEMAISHFRANLFFMGATSIDLNYGITDPYIPAANIKKKMMENSSSTVLVADHTKFGTISKAFVTDIRNISRIITDQALPETQLYPFQKAGVGIDLV